VGIGYPTEDLELWRRLRGFDLSAGPSLKPEDADRAESAFREFFQRLFGAIESGQHEVPQYEVAGINSDTERFIERPGISLETLQMEQAG
jgi:hypothetical protein